MALADFNDIVDVLTLLHDNSTAVTASGVGLDSAAAAQVIDLGSAEAEMYADWILDVSAIDVADGDESYQFVIEGSDDNAFAASEELARMHLGHNSVLVGSQSADAGRYVVGFGNKRNSRAYRYLRLSFVVAGTSPSITFVSRLSKRRHV